MNHIPATLISLSGLVLLGCVVCAGIPKESDPVVESFVRNDVNVDEIKKGKRYGKAL